MNAATARTERLHFKPVLTGMRWSAGRDVRWGAIDVRQARSQPAALDTLRCAALRASARVIRVSSLMSAAWDDAHASVALAADLHDSLKHFHVLATYLETVEYEPIITEADIVASRRGVAGIRVGRAEIAAEVRQLAVSHDAIATDYDQLSRTVAEPVLASILRFLANDERRCAHTLNGLRAAALLVE